MREILRIDEVAARLSLTKSQIYHLLRHPEHPLPHKKAGKVILMDWQKILAWYDGLPGRDLEE